VKDEILMCQQCERLFVFTAEEAERYESQGFDPPRRCRDCRKHKTKGGEDPSKRKDRRSARRSRESAWY
jgi:hypothetical protein